MNKGLKWALISLPILVGGYLVYRTLRKKPTEPVVPSKEEPTPKETTSPVTTPANTDFPLKKGSKGDKVRELQSYLMRKDSKALPKYGVDGAFGNETESALKRLYNKKTIDTQADLDVIKADVNFYRKGSPLVYKYDSPIQQVSPFLTIK